jgi:hypothetical protein
MQVLIDSHLVILPNASYYVQLLLLDYIQRIPPPGDHGDKRGCRQRYDGLLAEFARRDRRCRGVFRRPAHGHLDSIFAP